MNFLALSSMLVFQGSSGVMRSKSAQASPKSSRLTSSHACGGEGRDRGERVNGEVVGTEMLLAEGNTQGVHWEGREVHAHSGGNTREVRS